MVIKYSDFIKENNNPKPEDFGIKKYKWDGDYLDCYQDVIIAYQNNDYVNLPIGSDLTKLPFKFGKIFGRFACEMELATLEGCPSYVQTSLDISCNNLTNLNGCTKEIGRDFLCTDNKLSSFDGCPKIVRDFHAGKNPVPDILDNYPVCIIKQIFTCNQFEQFGFITKLIRNNQDIFLPLLDNKIAFHQQIMRMAPEVIPYYKTIKHPSKKSII